MDAQGVTQLLRAWGAGDETARDKLFPLVYAELRRQARRYMQRQPDNHTLQTTALVHEAYLRLVGHDVAWEGRAHFFAYCATVMRRLLVDYASKRAGRLHITLSDVDLPAPETSLDVLALHEALERLATFDPRASRIVELRFFGGLTEAETARVLQISQATAKRDWADAKAWLWHELTKSHF